MKVIYGKVSWQFASFLFGCCFVASTANSKNDDDWAVPLTDAMQLLEAENYDASLKAFSVEADKGNGLAHFNLALFYDLGWGVIPNPKTACTWFHKAAMHGIPMAMQRTGDCISNGIIETQEGQTSSALSWYMKATSQGLYDSLCLAGQLILSKNTGLGEIENGIQLCMEGAQKGSVSAQATLGEWYFTGTYLEQNYQLAFELLAQAANKQHGNAAYLLAQYFDKGIGTPIDTVNALKYYELAASKGKYEAYLPTALLYWQAYSKSTKSELLAKSYLWGSVACAVSTSDAKNERLLFSALKNEVPISWTKELDTKAKSHLFQHHQDNNEVPNKCSV